jgi:hypothetical protein
VSIFLETNHLLLRAPDGGVEDVARMRDAGFSVIFCNVGDYPASDWQVVRDRARAAGVKCGPWLRTADGHGVFDPDRLMHLIDVADSWDWAPLVCNSEKEIDHSGSALTQFIRNEIGDRDAAISTEVRPFADVDWKPLGSSYPILPQNFPAETGIGDSDDTIRMNWYAAGAICVVITYGSYGGMDAGDFDRLSPFGVYTADDCGNDFAAWKPLGSCAPCRNNGGGGDDVADKLPAGAFDDCKKFEEQTMKRPDGKTATCWASRSESLKAMRERIIQLEDRIGQLEKRA